MDKADYLKRKQQESLNIMSESTNDKKYFSASRQLDFCSKELEKIN